MDYEKLKNEFKRIIKEQIEYFNTITTISSTKTLSEQEKLEIYRNTEKYYNKYYEIGEKLHNIIIEQNQSIDNINDIIIEFDVDKNLFKNLKSKRDRFDLLKWLNINSNTSKYTLTIKDLLFSFPKSNISTSIIQNNQKLFEKKIYALTGYKEYENKEHSRFEESEYPLAQYIDINFSICEIKIPQSQIIEYEKDKIIIQYKEFVNIKEIQDIFNKELLNDNNESIDKCIKRTEEKITELNNIRALESKKNKSNNLYKEIEESYDNSNNPIDNAMDYETIKKKFILIKKLELEYINYLSSITIELLLMQLMDSYKYSKKEQKINLMLHDFERKINDLIKILYNKFEEYKKTHNVEDDIIEVQLPEDYLSHSSFFGEKHRNAILKYLKIDKNKPKYTLRLSSLSPEDFKDMFCFVYETIDLYSLYEYIYLYNGYSYQKSNETWNDYYDLCLDYYNLWSGYIRYIDPNDKDEFEKNHIVINNAIYVKPYEVINLFREIVKNNKSLDEILAELTKNIEELNALRTPEYKEKLLLDKINEIYKKVKGEYIKKEILYNGKFLELIKETYKLPNKRIIEQEKILKKDKKDSVIIIPVTINEDYIITFQNRTKDKIIAEFPTGYIKNGEDPIEAAKRELQEKTGYTSNELFKLDEANYLPGIDNSKTYIVLAGNCTKTNNTKLVGYGLFNKTELKQLIDSNIMNDSMNKLAYYNLLNNIEIECYNDKTQIKKKVIPTPEYIKRFDTKYFIKE